MFLQKLCEMCTDNSFTVRNKTDVRMQPDVSYPSHLNFVTTIPCEMQLNQLKE